MKILMNEMNFEMFATRGKMQCLSGTMPSYTTQYPWSELKWDYGPKSKICMWHFLNWNETFDAKNVPSETL